MRNTKHNPTFYITQSIKIKQVKEKEPINSMALFLIGLGVAAIVLTIIDVVLIFLPQ